MLQKKTDQMVPLKDVFAVFGAVVFVVVSVPLLLTFITSIPDIIRYIRIHEM